MNNNVIDFEIYKGKPFSSICKEIVVNQNNKKDQLDILISDLRALVKSTNDAIVIVPLIRDFIEIGVKNDEQLVKLIAVVQKIITRQSEDGDVNSLTLTDEEREALLKEVKNIASETQKTVDEEKKEMNKNR